MMLDRYKSTDKDINIYNIIILSFLWEQINET